MNPIIQSTTTGISVLSKIALFTLLGIQAGSAVDRYVSTTGSNGNPGTLAQPWATIRYGANHIGAGDTLYVRGGTYYEEVLVNTSGAAGNPLTICNYPNESPVIDGSTLAELDWRMLVNLNGNYIHMSGFEVRNCNMQVNQPYPAFPAGGYGIKLSGIYNKVSNMYVHNNRSTGILAGGDNSIVEYCTATGNCQDNRAVDGVDHVGWGNGISVSRGGNADANSRTDNAIVRHCVSYNNWGEGIDAFEADGTILEDNISYDNFSVNLYISDARNTLVQRNIAYTSSSAVITGASTITLADEKASSPRSSNNTIINNFLYGSRFEAFYWSLVSHGLDNVLIANNTLVNAQLRIGTTFTPNNVNSFVRNNIIASYNGNPVALANNTTGITFSNNLWSSAPPAALTGTAGVTGNAQLALTGSLSPGALTGDYFRLLPASPAINKGVTMAGYTDYDFFGTARVGTPDIGGHEIDDVPAPWATQDIGAVGATGSAYETTGTFTVTGSGVNIWDTADEFRYVSQPSSGDCSISARVATQQNTDPYSKAGVMIREDNTAGSRYAAVLVTPGNGITFRWRSATNGICTQAAYVTGVAAPQYVKIVRSGGYYSGYYSANGSTWTQIGSNQPLTLASTATIGLAVASDLDGSLSTATFDTVVPTP